MTARAAASDRLAGATIVVLAVILGALFLLPLYGLIDRAAGSDLLDIATSSYALDALRLSLITATITTVLAVLLGTPAAWLLARRRFPGRGVVDALIDLPIVLPPTVAGVALLTAFGRRGVVGEPLEELTGVTLAFTTTAVVLAQFLVAAPFYVRAARSGFETVDSRFEQVAYTLGAGRLRAFLRVVVPQARPALVGGIVLCWARALGELGATLIFAGNLQGETQTMPLAIVQAFESSSLGLDGATALSVILVVVALVTLVALRAVSGGGIRLR